MAMCEFCRGEMTAGGSCTVEALHVDGRRFELARFGSEPGPYGSRAAQCGDCGVVRGGLHHLGCDLQTCPRCGGQLLSCGCRFDEDGPEDDDWLGDDPDDWGAPLVPFGVDANGSLLEAGTFGGVPVLVHHDDLPESDVTTVHGIPCTTAVRTLIDIAATVEPADLHHIVKDVIARRIVSESELSARLEQPDMAVHVGAALVRRVLGTLR